MSSHLFSDPNEQVLDVDEAADDTKATHQYEEDEEGLTIEQESTPVRRSTPMWVWLAGGLGSLFLFGLVGFATYKIMAPKSKGQMQNNTSLTRAPEMVAPTPPASAPTVDAMPAAAVTESQSVPQAQAAPIAEPPTKQPAPAAPEPMPQANKTMQANTVQAVTKPESPALMASAMGEVDNRIKALHDQINELQTEVERLKRRLADAPTKSELEANRQDGRRIQTLETQLAGTRSALVALGKRFEDKENGMRTREVVGWQFFRIVPGGNAEVISPAGEPMLLRPGSRIVGTTVSQIDLGALEVVLSDGRVIR
ncbi:MAG: hypothetical protein JNM52_05665 [Betaproteobacteria bacterium]|nr:hypothetical protein [Betaproteobacteria bacterium]